jgi:hypothetical protein
MKDCLRFFFFFPPRWRRRFFDGSEACGADGAVWEVVLAGREGCDGFEGGMFSEDGWSRASDADLLGGGRGCIE